MHPWCKRILMLGLILCVMLIIPFRLVQAEKGVPGSPLFAYGMVIYPAPAPVEPALAAMNDIRPDWLYVPVIWSTVFPSQAKSNIDMLDTVMDRAAEDEIPVVIGISSAPDWASTSQGPDLQKTAQLVLFLAKRYPSQLRAVELFPRANTYSGWNAPVNPQLYVQLLQAVQNTLKSENISLILVAAGLQPLSSHPAQEDMDDLQFLQQLYQEGLQQVSSVISIQFAELTGDPLSAPSSQEPRRLRHYEQVRRMMTDHQDTNSLIWITHLNLPTGAINPKDQSLQDVNQQADWLKASHTQIRSQLYIGAAFLQSINPGPETGSVSLLSSNGAQHPFLAQLKSLIGKNASDILAFPGRPKNRALVKDRKD